MRTLLAPVLLGLAAVLSAPLAGAQSSFQTFESGQVRPLALSPDGSTLFALNTPDGRLEIFAVDGGGLLTHTASVRVGMEPVAVAARTNSEVWVVNHLSDSVSVVTGAGSLWEVTRTLLVGDEPNDVVCAGPTSGGFFTRCFVSAAHRGAHHDRVAGHDDPLGQYGTPGIGRADVWVFDATALGTSLKGDPLTVIGLFGDKPRGLAASDDGTSVFAAIFHSGNRTTTLNEGVICNTSNQKFNQGQVEPACTLATGEASEGGYPVPHENVEGDRRPELGLIVKQDHPAGAPGTWSDELGRDWSGLVRFNLPDRDVFEIDADAPTPAAVDASNTCADGAGCWAGVGTVLFNLAVHPHSGKVYVSNSDAQNHVRFEGPGEYVNDSDAGPKDPAGEPATVQGNLAQMRITVLDGANVAPRHLNKHIDYSVLPAPASVRADSLSMPLGMAIDDGGTPGTSADDVLYVAAFGSQSIGVFDVDALEDDSFTPDGSAYIPLAGGGPAGLVLGAANRLYVLTRFDNAVRVVNPDTKSQLQALALHNPEPASVVTGRPFLYDAQLTSSNGEASCASCHIFGDMDDLGWDLGDPDGAETANQNPFNETAIGDGGEPRVFHPMKGPMTTQTLRGMDNQGPQHWRGDRQVQPGGQVPNLDENLAFNAFLVAFEGLVGLDVEETGRAISAGQMQQFADFALQIRLPPNPLRQLNDNLRTGPEVSGNSTYHNTNGDLSTCNDCHTLDPAGGFFGGNGESTFEGESQHFKVPHLRNVYQKIGMFGMASAETPQELLDQGFPCPPICDKGFRSRGSYWGDPGALDDEEAFRHLGDQIRGFGFAHDGGIDTLFRFTQATVFFSLSNIVMHRDLEAFMMVFPTDFAPMVGQQTTLTAGLPQTDEDAIVAKVAEMEFYSGQIYASQVTGGSASHCDLVATVLEGGVEHGYLWDPEAGTAGRYFPDTCADPTFGTYDPESCGTQIKTGAMRAKATTHGDPVTWTCVPPGSGYRAALDRDEDTLVDGVETNTGVYVSPTDTGTSSALRDTDADGFDDADEVAQGTDPVDPASYPGAPAAVPALSPLGLGLLVAALTLSAAALRRRRVA